MNFKTTIALLIVLVAIGGYFLFTLHEPTATNTPPPAATPAKLVDLTPENVTAVKIVLADGPTTTLAKSANGDWRITSPIDAAADKFNVDDLVRAVTDLQSKGEVDPATASGVQSPHEHVLLTTGDGKSIDLAIGDKTPAGDGLYVQLAGKAKADTVGTDLADRLDKLPNSVRDARLVLASSDQITQLKVKPAAGTEIDLQKSDGRWNITAPTLMPADDSAVSDLLFGLTGARATDYVTDNAADIATKLGPTRLSIAYSTQPPATQPALTAPATSQPATEWKTLTFGRYADITKQNLMAASTDLPGVVQVSATAITSFDKTPLDLRDKVVFTADPNRVDAVTVTDATNDLPASQPQSTLEPVVRITRRPPAVAPLGPATTQAATTQAASQPASKWITPPNVSDSAVDSLLGDLHPLRAEKFLATPSTQPAAGRYLLKVTSPGTGPVLPGEWDLTVEDRGPTEAPTASYNGLTFEISRTLLDHVKAVAGKPTTPSAPATPAMPMSIPGMPG